MFSYKKRNLLCPAPIREKQAAEPRGARTSSGGWMAASSPLLLGKEAWPLGSDSEQERIQKHPLPMLGSCSHPRKIQWETKLVEARILFSSLRPFRAG